MNAGGLVFLLLLLPVWREELTRLAARADLWARGENLVDCCWVLLSCLTGIAIGFAGIGLQKHVTASAFLVLATGSRVALITLTTSGSSTRSRCRRCAGSRLSS